MNFYSSNLQKEELKFIVSRPGLRSQAGYKDANEINNFDEMKYLFYAAFKYYLFWILFFTSFKILFVVYNYSIIADFPFSYLLGIFRHGIFMDLSAAGYFNIIPGIILSLGYLFTSRFSTSLLKYYTLPALVVLTFLGISDIGLYKLWGSHLNSQILTYMETPGGIIASLSWMQIILSLALFTTIVWGGLFVYGRLLPQKKLGNALLVITANHTSLQPGPSSIIEPSTYRIPLILLGGVVKEPGICEHFGNQNDLALCC